ncbi:MAG: hypothetical protein U0231_11305 [Nitrospiraceae bacterium]
MLNGNYDMERAMLNGQHTDEQMEHGRPADRRVMSASEDLTPREREFSNWSGRG